MQNNNFARAITLFCTFLYRPCTNTTWKCLIAGFMEDVNKRRRISFFLSKLECGPQEINSREICLHLSFFRKLEQKWQRLKKREFILKLMFSLPLPSSMLKLPIVATRNFQGVLLGYKMKQRCKWSRSDCVVGEKAPIRPKSALKK